MILHSLKVNLHVCAMSAVILTNIDNAILIGITCVCVVICTQCALLFLSFLSSTETKAE